MASNGKALLVGDVQRDFMEPGGALYCGDAARAIIPRIQQLIDEFHRDGALVVFVQDTHVPNDPEFRLWPPHCVKGTKGHELLPELDVRPADLRVEKPHYSAFHSTHLAQRLHDAGVHEVHLTGDCTSICVLFTATDAFNHGFRVVVHRDAVADFDPQAHEFALQHMEKILGATIL
ncbi:MAG TPA: isochorismatase family cysteine hydrolase [Verrucomicrobiae bacterium]|nr:isochorismatase family cysteine hydrolase [Verrucomicrobiae bacterium]